MARDRKGRKQRRDAGPPRPPTPAEPKVHVKVALANMDLRAAATLIKPAILYADDVTLYSPAASMFSAVRDLGRVREPREQLALILSLVQRVPQLRGQLDASDEVLDQLMTFLSMDRRSVNRMAKATRSTDQINAMNSAMERMSAEWVEQMSEAVESAKATMGADELLIAVDAGAVKVADLLGDSATAMTAESLRLATGGQSEEPLDDLLANFLGRLLELVIEPRTFPLFDAQSSGLLRAFEHRVAQGERKAMDRATEVAAATSFMGYLPNFTSMPMDEVLDLRRELNTPLRRFRGAMAAMSRDFESRPIDETFEMDVEDAWRREVEPALTGVREALAEHGLLREVASVASGDPRRLIVEAGGVVAAAHGEVFSLSGLLTAGAAVGVPMLDVIGRAIGESTRGRREVRNHAFYFLHRVAEHSGGNG